MNVDGVMYIGDPHLTSFVPGSRIDDFPEVIFRKMQFCLQTAIDMNYRRVFILGDFSHVRQISTSYLIRLLGLFYWAKQEGLIVEAISGNHDVAYERADTISSSPLGAMYEAGLIAPVSGSYFKIRDKDVYVRGFNSTDALEDKPTTCSGIFSMCLAHRFLEDPDPLSLSFQQAKSMGFDLYVLGHDHVERQPFVENDQYFLVPGGLSRGTSHKFNLQKEVVVYGFTFSDAGDPLFKRIKVPIQNSSEVFSARVDTKGFTVVMKLSEEIGSVLERLKNIQLIQGDVYEILDSFKESCSEKVFQTLERYFVNYGIVRRAEEHDE